MEVVISGENRYDDFGNFFFKDKGGTEHKIGTKRKNFDELVNLVVENPDRAVKLTFDSFKKIDYIVGIELLEFFISTLAPIYNLFIVPPYFTSTIAGYLLSSWDTKLSLASKTSSSEPPVMSTVHS